MMIKLTKKIIAPHFYLEKLQSYCKLVISGTVDMPTMATKNDDINLPKL